MPPSWSQQRVGAGEPPAAHVAGPLALAVEEAVLAAVARAVLGHQRDVLVLAKVLLPGNWQMIYYRHILYPF